MKATSLDEKPYTDQQNNKNMDLSRYLTNKKEE
jgi:hypothetical protein